MSTGTPEQGVAARLSFLDRYLAVWILAAMAVGLGRGRLMPGLGDASATVAVSGVPLPIALGLPVMMYAVPAEVRYDRLDTVTRIALPLLVHFVLMRAGSMLLLKASASTTRAAPRSPSRPRATTSSGPSPSRSPPSAPPRGRFRPVSSGRSSRYPS